MEYVKGPDFPTGGLILGREGLISAYTTGNGSITIRSKAHIDRLDNGKTEIIVTEIPYGINKTRIVQKIAEVAKDKIIDDILIDMTNILRFCSCYEVKQYSHQ